MKISINWLKDFVDIEDNDVDKLISDLTVKTAELEGVEYKGRDINDLVVGQIVHLENHPNSTKLHLLKVDIGNQTLDIVCGASNVALNAKVALVKAGGSVVGAKISESKVGGYLSCGMCCSEEELGLSENSEGIIILPQDSIVGSDAKKLLGLDDVVLEIDNKSLTNRPDLWGHYGFAREVSALLNKKLKKLEVADFTKYDSLPQVKINVDTTNCLKYTAIKIESIALKESPIFMKTRLAYCDIRPINFMADLTNYVMLEIGQPMHAFDGEKVKGINVRECAKQTKFTTLDGEEKILAKGTMTINDENDNIVAIAGVMGGKNSEITETTKSLLLESATFVPASVRKTAVSINTRTDSSNRYEKSLDTNFCELASARVIKLILDNDKGAKVTTKLSKFTNKEHKPLVIELSKNTLSKYLGTTLTDKVVEKILTSLEFEVTVKKDQFVVTVPTFRATKDISIEADLIEEVARMYGYDKILPTPNSMPVQSVNQNVYHNDIFKTKQILAEKYDMNEVHSYVWKNHNFYKEINLATSKNILLLNSISPDNSELRDDLIVSLMQIISENIKYFDEISIFEIGQVFNGLDDNKKVIESAHLGIMQASSVKKEMLYKSFAVKIKTTIKLLKGIEIKFAKSTNLRHFDHPVYCADIVYKDEILGSIAVVHPKTSTNIDKKSNIVYADIDFVKLSNIKKETDNYKVVSKYPTTEIDLCFLVDKNLTYDEVQKHIKDINYKTLNEFKLIETYQDEKLGDKKSVTIKFVLGSQNKTLTTDDVKIFTDRIIKVLSQKGIAPRY